MVQRRPELFAAYVGTGQVGASLLRDTGKGRYGDTNVCSRAILQHRQSAEEKLILIEHAGHFALVTHREEFLSALVKHVRPLARESKKSF